MTASFWDAHVDAFMRTVGETPDSSRYVGRRRRAVAANLYTDDGGVPYGYLYASGLDYWSQIERAHVAARRADAAVIVLAATDSLPASRLLYRELLRAGALSSPAGAA